MIVSEPMRRQLVKNHSLSFLIGPPRPTLISGDLRDFAALGQSQAGRPQRRR